MNSKERFTAVCEHRNPDRFPIDYWPSPQAQHNMEQFYGLKTEEEMLDRLGVDFYYLSLRDISQNESSLPFYKGPKLEMTEKERVCPFGIRFIRGAYGSKFDADNAIKGPLEEAKSASDILDHSWPKLEWFDLEPLLAECELHKDRVIIGGMWAGILGDGFRMLGFENFLLNTALNPDMIKALVNHLTDFYIEFNDRIFSTLRTKMDICYFGNDFGTQNGLLFSEKMFCEFFLENIKRITSHAHGYGLKVMMHSCGSVAQIIDLLIEAGVDILDPIQTTAKEMNPADLKARFGGRIVFHGGVDTQQILPFSTPEQVYQHAVETLRTLGTNGGYIFSASQMLQRDVPPENIDAMYKAVRQYTP